MFKEGNRIFKSKEDLRGRQLTEGDIVVFNVKGDILRYKVGKTHLSFKPFHNNKIFNILDLDEELFCSGAYGYVAGSGDWPQYNVNDFEAATRCVQSLYEEIEDERIKNKKGDLGVNMFKTGDRVKIERKAVSREQGWKNDWVYGMDDFVYTEQIIEQVNTDKNEVRFEDVPYWWPTFILSKVEWDDMYRRALVRFMELKQAKLGPDHNYFNYDDAQDIMSWPEIDAHKVYNAIKEEIGSPDFDYGLHSGCCPFCITIENVYGTLKCSECSYGRRHGECPGSLSDWKNIACIVRDNFEWVPLFKKVDAEMDIKQQLKMWTEKSFEDKESQKYLTLVRDNHLDGISLVLVDRKGKHYGGNYILTIRNVGSLLKHDWIDNKHSDVLELNNIGEIVEE